MLDRELGDEGAGAYEDAAVLDALDETEVTDEGELVRCGGAYLVDRDELGSDSAMLERESCEYLEEVERMETRRGGESSSRRFCGGTIRDFNPLGE